EQASEPALPVPDTYLIEGVPILSQLPDFPTGCESVSACMLLMYNGYEITPDVFIDKYLSKSDDFYHKNGICWGPDPYTHFIGDPRQSTAYGCMAPVIKNAIDKALGRSDWGGITDCESLNQLCSSYICKDIPVMVWTSLNMESPRPGSVWRLPDGSEYQWLANEHCMVLVGYDESHYYFNDPNSGKTVKYPKEVSERRYAAFEYQSIVIMPE
ncbi:MAG: C39 family peptidase, partial [Oscillospiraceae bacterium]|nr:C39 family peptidase [Oscillospiraceae bacterium]